MGTHWVAMSEEPTKPKSSGLGKVRPKPLGDLSVWNIIAIIAIIALVVTIAVIAFIVLWFSNLDIG